jgi:hypothetical protein
MQQNPNPAQRNPNIILGFPSPNRAFSRTYADPPRLFLWSPLPASGRTRERWRCSFASGSSSVFSVFVSGSSGLIRVPPVS